MEYYQFSKIQKNINKKSILLISDQPRFIDAGGMIGFIEVQGKITIELNMQVISAHLLEVDPALTEIAHRVIN